MKEIKQIKNSTDEKWTGKFNNSVSLGAVAPTCVLQLIDLLKLRV